MTCDINESLREKWVEELKIELANTEKCEHAEECKTNVLLEMMKDIEINLRGEEQFSLISN